MLRYADALQSVAAALWVGGMWVAGYVAAPVLFAVIPDRMLAGTVAGRLFSSVAWIGIACAACLLILNLLRYRADAWRQPVFRVVLLMLVLVCAGEFGVQPVLAGLRAQALPQAVMESALRDRFAAWHAVSGLIYIAQSLLGLALVVLSNRATRRGPGGVADQDP